jgi:FAD-dependent urate hydroxylase
MNTNLLSIGAGPFGLSMAAYARHLGLDYLVVGKSMEFWSANMPQGMYLRSACDWHLDPINEATIEHFLETRGQVPADVEPLSLQFYLEYTRWFQEQKGIEVIPSYVERLDQVSTGNGRFQATLTDGQTITAHNVVVALGFKHFKYEPETVVSNLPSGYYAHTCDLVDFTSLAGKRCLIIGGRQSAFEWAALLNEAGASAVHVSHRHDSPAFAEADWSWVNPLVDAMVDNPGWFRRLTPAEKDDVNHRLWAEGRLKVEPWLESRVLKETTQLWPRTQVARCEQLPGGELAVALDNGQLLAVDHIILATGYKVQIDQVPLLAQGNLLASLAVEDGYPLLDEHFQTNIPGLFITSMPAVRDFGPFFGFTIAVRTSARLIGEALVRQKNSVAAKV